MKYFLKIGKPVTIFLTAVLVHLSFGYIILFNPLILFTKELIQSNLEKGAYKENTELLVFSLKDIAGKKIDFVRLDKKEFRYNGNMYDILEESCDNDKVYFRCYLDEKETFLASLFDKHLNKTRNDKDLYRVFSSFNLIPVWFEQNSPDISSLRQLACLKFEKDIFRQTNFPLVLTPPPEYSV